MNKRFAILLIVALGTYTSGAFSTVTAECQNTSSNLSTDNYTGCCGGSGATNHNDTTKCTPQTYTATIEAYTGTGVSTQDYSVDGSITGTTTRDFEAVCEPTAGETDVTSPPYSLAGHCTSTLVWCYSSADGSNSTQWDCYNWNTDDNSDHMDVDNVDCNTISMSGGAAYSNVQDCDTSSYLTDNT